VGTNTQFVQGTTAVTITSGSPPLTVGTVTVVDATHVSVAISNVADLFFGTNFSGNNSGGNQASSFTLTVTTGSRAVTGVTVSETCLT
jgi:hypothetical protein